MLVIRDQQLHILGEHAHAQFLAELMELVREQHAARVEHLDDAALRRRIGLALHRAGRNGLRWRSSLTLFVLLSFVYGPEFDERAAVRRYLDEMHTGIDERMMSIGSDAPAECWEELPPSALETAWRLTLGE